MLVAAVQSADERFYFFGYSSPGPQLQPVDAFLLVPLDDPAPPPPPPPPSSSSTESTTTTTISTTPASSEPVVDVEPLLQVGLGVLLVFVRFFFLAAGTTTLFRCGISQSANQLPVPEASAASLAPRAPAPSVKTSPPTSASATPTAAYVDRDWNAEQGGSRSQFYISDCFSSTLSTWNRTKRFCAPLLA